MEPPPHNTRREFLQGRAAADALVRLTDEVQKETSESSPDQPLASGSLPSRANSDRPAVGSFLLQLGRTAMACQFELYFNGGQCAHATEAGIAALDKIDALEDQLSAYREHSELSRLNRTANLAPVSVEPDLFKLLKLSLQIHADTDGAFDITSSPLSSVWGFSRRAGKIPSAKEITSALKRIGSEHVTLDSKRQTVHFQKPDLELSLNSIGKGYALDQAADLLQAEAVCDFIFHGGQSSVLAAGEHMATPGSGWTVGLRHPLRPDARLAEFYLRNQALATSGTGRQNFIYQGKKYGHILDPRTGQPVDGVYSSTVIAPTAAEADALATAFYVMGPKIAQTYCQSRPEVGMLLVTSGEKQGTIAVHSHGLTEDSWRRCEE